MKRQLFSNLGIKLSSLALALVLWFSLYGGREGLPFIKGGKTEIIVPVKVLGPPFSPFQIKVKPEKVKLVLTGSRGALKRLTVSGISLFVTVEDLKKGEYELRPRVYLPEGIKVSRRQPETVRVILDDRWTMANPPVPPFTKGGSREDLVIEDK